MHRDEKKMPHFFCASTSTGVFVFCLILPLHKGCPWITWNLIKMGSTARQDSKYFFNYYYVRLMVEKRNAWWKLFILYVVFFAYFSAAKFFFLINFSCMKFNAPYYYADECDGSCTKFVVLWVCVCVCVCVYTLVARVKMGKINRFIKQCVI